MTTSRELDPSGNGYQDEGFNADLCCGCLKAGLENMFLRVDLPGVGHCYDHEQGRRFEEWFRTPVKVKGNT